MTAGKPSLRARVHRQLDPRVRPGQGLSRTNIVLVAAILAAVVLAILETEPTLSRPFGRTFEHAERALGVLFALELVARLWTCVEDRDFGPGWRGRLRFLFSPVAVIDLLAVVSSFASGGQSGMLLRLLRLLRILRVAKLGRLSRAWNHITMAVHSRRSELLLSLYAGLVVMVVSSTLLYLVEGAAQPDKFGSIPRALWWSVATLTTIGYGDVYPITPLGRVLAAITALTSIGVVAMPTGILAAAFSDAVQRHREAEAAEHEPEIDRAPEALE
ncbi:MAG: potassium channel family protein [Phenylobacterium sp.]